METPRLKEFYNSKVRPALQKELGITNVMAVPRLEKVVVNVGMGNAYDTKKRELVLKTLGEITGQKPAIRKAKKSIAAFKIRQGVEVGAAVTLRGNRMFEFLDKLINVTLPRVRDFRGLNPKAVSGRSFSLGIKEHVVFPEINFDAVDKIHGLEITVVTTGRETQETYKLLEMLGFPFKTENK